MNAAATKLLSSTAAGSPWAEWFCTDCRPRAPAASPRRSTACRSGPRYGHGVCCCGWVGLLIFFLVQTAEVAAAATVAASTGTKHVRLAQRRRGSEDGPADHHDRPRGLGSCVETGCMGLHIPWSTQRPIPLRPSSVGGWARPRGGASCLGDRPSAVCCGALTPPRAYFSIAHPLIDLRARSAPRLEGVAHPHRQGQGGPMECRDHTCRLVTA